LGARAVAFKDQAVPRLYAEQLANLVRHGNLSLASHGLLDKKPSAMRHATKKLHFPQEPK
jgi:hypothetical protein